MRNIFLEGYNTKKKNLTNFYNSKNKNKILDFIENSKNMNYLSNGITKIKYDISSIDYNSQKNLFKKNHHLHKNNFLRNKSIKTCLKIDVNYFNNSKKFVREFENLFEQTTNKNDFFNGQETENMGDFLNLIKQYNYNNFIKTLKRKKGINSKVNTNYKLKKKLYTQPYNFKGYLNYSKSSHRNNRSKNEKKNNCSEYGSSTIATATSSIKNLGDEYNVRSDEHRVYNTENGELNLNFDGIKDNNNGRKKRKSFNFNTNENKRLANYFAKSNKFRSFSYKERSNRTNTDNNYIHYKTKTNLNLNLI